MSGIVKYLTRWGGNTIDRVSVIRETPACVYVASTRGERREAKHSEFSQYHDTWEVAHAYLIKKAEHEVKAARLQLEKVNGKLGNIKGMKAKSVSP